MHTEELTIILNIVTKEDGRDTFLEAMTKWLPEIRREEGCIQAFLYSNPKDHNTFFMVETWESYSSWKKHIQAPSVSHLTLVGNDTTSKWELHKLSLCEI